MVLIQTLIPAGQVRPTEDVDVIVEIASTVKYMLLSEQLLKLKFSPDQSANAPICRWNYLGIVVDIMPLEENIIGFSNKYYKEGFKHKEKLILPDGQEIFTLPLGYFLLTKFEAFNNRGIGDPRLSKDLEDITAILSDPKNFNDIFKYNHLVVILKKSFKDLFDNPDCAEAIRSFLQGHTLGQFDLIIKRSLLIN